jgi:hypothetical protein
MKTDKSVARFFFCLCLVFGFMMLPWTGVRAIYGDYFYSWSQFIFTGDYGNWNVTFCRPQPWETPQRSTDLRIVIVNQKLMKPDGSGPIRNVDLSSTIIYPSAALLVALIVSTPVSLRSRFQVAAIGLVILQVLGIAYIGLAIVNQSQSLIATPVTPWWIKIAEVLQGMIASQLNLALPLVLWLYLTFREPKPYGKGAFASIRRYCGRFCWPSQPRTTSRLRRASR